MNKLIDTIIESTPHVDTHYRIGMRVIKTAAAGMICLLISLIQTGSSIIQLSAISAIVTLRATQQDTLRSGIFRVFGTLIGGVLGIIAVFIGMAIPYYDKGIFVIVIPLMLVVDLYICNLLKLQDSCSISCVVVLIVASYGTNGADSSALEALFYTLHRVRDTLLGVVVATVLNSIPQPKKNPAVNTEESCEDTQN